MRGDTRHDKLEEACSHIVTILLYMYMHVILVKQSFANSLRLAEELHVYVHVYGSTIHVHTCTCTCTCICTYMYVVQQYKSLEMHH